MHYAKITGTGMYVPPNVVTNNDLESLMETSDEWIRQRTGIEQRRHVQEGEGASDLALPAAQAALADAGITAQELDLIIFTSLSPDLYFPGSGVLLQQQLGLQTTPAMDLRNQCSGFLYALNVGQNFIQTGQYKRILIVGAEVHSHCLDMTTRGREVAVLFGDGAGAVVLEHSQTPGVLSCHLHAQGEHARKLMIERPGSREGRLVDYTDLESCRVYPYMEGRFVYKHAVTRLTEVVHEVLEHNKYQLEDVDCFLFHQANLRINEKVASILSIPEEKCPSNIQKYGNCSAASIPILLHESLKNGTIKEGDLVCLAAFGSGFTWAGALIQF